MKNALSAQQRIIDTINAPLGFFVLALFIVEGFLATVLIGANLEKSAQITVIWLGVGLFVLVMVLVFLLVWFKPQNLIFDKETLYKDRDRERTVYGMDSNVILLKSNLGTPGETNKEMEEK